MDRREKDPQLISQLVIRHLPQRLLVPVNVLVAAGPLSLNLDRDAQRFTGLANHGSRIPQPLGKLSIRLQP